MFSRCLISCLFSAVNNLRWVYFIFRLKDLPEYSNHGNVSSKFKNCNYTMTYLEIFWEYYFQLRTTFSYKHVWMTWLGIFFFYRKYNCYALINWRVFSKLRYLTSSQVSHCDGVVINQDLFGSQILVTTEGFVWTVNL